jgi:uncharacterized protein
MERDLLLIFTRNPALGKVKTRLAASIGDFYALEIYEYLLNHTKEIVSKVQATKRVLYSDEMNMKDIWENNLYQKQVQFGSDLGARMYNAFREGFENEYQKIVIIGSDLYDLEVSDIENAFLALDKHDVVVGPADDGGYYLLGLKSIPEGIFSLKKWGSDTVLKDTLKNIKHLDYHLLEPKNDIDTIEDIVNIEKFKKYLS